jgi:hypothetical protein
VVVVVMVTTTTTTMMMMMMALTRPPCHFQVTAGVVEEECRSRGLAHFEDCLLKVSDSLLVVCRLNEETYRPIYGRIVSQLVTPAGPSGGAAVGGAPAGGACNGLASSAMPARG